MNSSPKLLLKLQLNNNLCNSNPSNIVSKTETTMATRTKDIDSQLMAMPPIISTPSKLSTNKTNTNKTTTTKARTTDINSLWDNKPLFLPHLSSPQLPLTSPTLYRLPPPSKLPSGKTVNFQQTLKLSFPTSRKLPRAHSA